MSILRSMVSEIMDNIRWIRITVRDIFRQIVNNIDHRDKLKRIGRLDKESKKK